MRGMSNLDKKRLVFMEIIGIPVVFLTAIFLHFVYRLSDGAVWSILVGSVNESVWEHTKIFTLPYVIYAIWEFMVIKLPFKRFVVAKVIGLYTIIILIIVLFYTYVGITFKNELSMDVVIAFIAVTIAFVLSYILLINFESIGSGFNFAVLLLTLFLVMYLLFTIKPPHADIFLDPRTFSYGVPYSNNQNMEYYPNARRI